MINKIVFSLLLIAGISQLSHAQVLPKSDEILAKMVLANKYFMDKWPNPGKDIVTDKTRPSNLWTRATYYEGLMGLYYISNDTSYYKYAVDWAESHDWEPTYGKLSTRDGDHQCCGQTYLELYLLDPKPEKIAPITTNIDNMVNSSKSDDWSWVDAMQMSMPVFAKLGVVYNDVKYFDKMYDLYNFTKTQHGTNGLYNQADGLWWRDKDFDPPYKTPNGKTSYWSRGNGWVYAALVRVLDVIPETETHYQEYLDNYKEMSAALIQIQREDGFWNPDLADPDNYGGKETSGTGFFVYGLAWGINNSILDSATYMPAIIKGWNGLQNDALHNNGFLGWVQGTGKQASDGQPLSYTKMPNFEDFGLGAFLLAGSETYKLAPESLPLSLNIANTDSEIFVAKELNSNEYIIHLNLQKQLKVKIELIDINGRIVRQLVNNDVFSEGTYQLPFEAYDLNKGVYLIHSVIGRDSKIIKIRN